MGWRWRVTFVWGFWTIESGRKEKSKYMAELVNKYPQNAAGSFYVDDQCIDCDPRRETAPELHAKRMMVVTRMCINSRRAPRKKLSAKRLWRVVRSKRSAMTASTTLLRLFEPHPPMPQMRTFLRLFLFPTDAYRCPLGGLLSDRILWRFPEWLPSMPKQRIYIYE